jgi:uncharacterized protein YkwD
MSVTAQCVHGARVCVIPHHTNNYRPLALNRGPLAVISALLITAKLVALGALALTPLPAELSTITSARIVQLTNIEREQAGLNELVVNDVLARAAQQKADDMLAEDYFAHISPAGVTPWFWMSKEGYEYRVAGENLAIDFIQAEDVVGAWMASPTHKDNIVHTDYVEIGVAAATGEFQGGTSIVVVQMFGLPLGHVQSSQTTVSETQEEAVSATPTPSPVATILPEVEKTVPPAVPRISFNNGVDTVKNVIGLNVKGDAGKIVSILINNQVRMTTSLSADGIGSVKLNVKDLPDGELVIKAFSEDSEGVKSDLSTVLIANKDTQGPVIQERGVSFIISPATDTPTVAIGVLNDEYISLRVGGDNDYNELYEPADWVVSPLLDGTMNIALYDKAGNASIINDASISPSFYVERDTSFMNSSNRLSGLVKRVTLLSIIVILLLLSLAIIIKIRIQHPRMIVSASLVLLLASILFLW